MRAPGARVDPGSEEAGSGAQLRRPAVCGGAATGVVGGGLLAFAYTRLRAMDRPALIGAGTLAAGTWLFWGLLALIQELDNANRPDNTSGMALVGLVALILMVAYLVSLGRQWRGLRMAAPDR